MLRKLIFSIFIFILGAALGAGSLWIYWGFIVPYKQIRNLGILQTWYGALGEIHIETGKYPATLQEAAELFENLFPGGTDMTKIMNDIWGAPLHYFSTGDSYIIGSFGRDRSCDLSNLQTYLDFPINDRSPCYDPNRDTIVTDQGQIKCCGK